MTQTTYYTIVIGKRACIVKYAVSPAYEVKLFSGAWADPAEASKEFKIAVEGSHEFLTIDAFECKVEQLAYTYQQESAKLQDMKEEHLTSFTCKYGHIWEETAVNGIRRCTGSHCKAIQRLENGRWVTILPSPRIKSQEHVQQSSLF